MSNAIATFFINYDKLEKIAKVKNEELSAIDIKLSDFYHKMETIHLSHNTQGHKLIKELQPILHRRRVLKKENILIRSFIDSTDKSMQSAKERNKSALEKHHEIMKTLGEGKKV